MRYFLDTEFNDYGGELISLALVSEVGAKILYIATPCSNPTPWVAENVIPILDVGTSPRIVTADEFGSEIAEFLKDDKAPVIIADWPDDIRHFCAALITGPGCMVNLRSLQFEMVRVDSYPTTLVGAVQHNALWDALALRHKMVEMSAIRAMMSLSGTD